MRRAVQTALAMAAAGGLAAAALGDAVEVRAEKQTYPVTAPDRASRPNRAPEFAAKLKGRSSYTTEAVTLENRYLSVTLLPEFGGRITRAVFRPTGRQLFWELDEIRDGCSWSMGGGRWSFPFWEHGRHFDETGGYCVVRGDDGSVTVAVDMRFEDFLTRDETRRYGRATCLRLAQEVRLAPDEAAFTWTARVDNPLPVRYGFKLWYLLRQPAVAGAHVTMPAAGVTGHNAPHLEPWDAATRVGGHVPAAFAIGYRHDFAGWYFPPRDLNVLRVVDRHVAPGAKQVLYPPGQGAYIELWGGNHEVFEECGRMLPAFGGYELAVRVLAAEGIGPATFANAHAAVAARRDGDVWHVAIAPVRPMEDVTISLDLAGYNRTVSGESLSPEAPYACVLDASEAPTKPDVSVLRVGLTDADGRSLVEQAFPIDPGPLPEEAFAAVKARTDGSLPGGAGLMAEATDLASEHQMALPRAAGLCEKTLDDSEDVQALLDAARRLMRVRKESAEVLAGLEKVLAKDPANAWANLYKAMWLSEAGREGGLAACVARAESLPGGRYLAALRAVARKDYASAARHLEALLAMGPEATFSGPDDPSRALLQPGVFMAATRPRLLLAIAREALGDKGAARATLEGLASEDPACIEAWMLLGDAEKVRTLTSANASGRRAAEATLAALRAGRWRGIGRPEG